MDTRISAEALRWAIATTLSEALAGSLAEPHKTGAKAFWVRRGRAGRGDFASNLPALLPAAQRGPGLAAAKAAAAALGWPGAVEEAGGFLNFRFDDATLNAELERAAREGARYGAGRELAEQRFLVEFVSADPSGPLPFSLGRVAAAGDALCRLLALQGAEVTREFYLNDDISSSRVRLLGESVAAAYGREFDSELPVPEGALTDKFVRAVAHDIAGTEGNNFLLVPEAERTARFAKVAATAAKASQQKTLRAFGVRFDVWTSESALQADGRIEAILSRLEERGHTYREGGALWLASTAFGDEADRVLVRAGGESTYLAADIAYHVFKFERGFDFVFNIWTAEHRQYIERTRAALAAVGLETARLEVVACEGARWLVDGKPVARNRDGSVFSLDEAVASVAPERLRFLFLQGDWTVPLGIEAERTRLDDETNPAYAALLLPSRLSTMLAAAEAQGTPVGDTGNEPGFTAEERALAVLVALWPDTAREAAMQRAPHRVAAYVSEMAAATRDLLAASRPGEAVRDRLPLLRAARVVATSALETLGIAANERF